MKAELDAKDIANMMTVNVTIKRYDSWRIRLWIALKLIEFAAWLAWVNIEVNDESLTDGD